MNVFSAAKKFLRVDANQFEPAPGHEAKGGDENCKPQTAQVVEQQQCTFLLESRPVRSEIAKKHDYRNKQKNEKHGSQHRYDMLSDDGSTKSSDQRYFLH
jgi:hypothetical protein